MIACEIETNGQVNYTAQLQQHLQMDIWHRWCLWVLLKPILDHVLDECVPHVFVISLKVYIGDSWVICKHVHDDDPLLQWIAVYIFTVQDMQGSMSLLLQPFCISNHTLLNHIGCRESHSPGSVTNWDGVTSNSEKTQPVCWEVLLHSEENEDEFKSKSHDSKMMRIMTKAKECLDLETIQDD
ncbi:hypothetical protein BDR07DRAFT_1374731 [Suillus spraguei]|nr:hypothetical protein BDR07DRAFT_1374731 [Suillus spraguei]